MADLVTPRHYENGAVGGTPLTATKLNADQAVLDALDAVQQDHEDRIGNLESATSSDRSAYRRGQTADAGAPTLDTALFLNEQTSELWVPRGDAWYKTALTAVAGVSGGSNAPTGFSAVVQSGNTVDLAWTLPTPPGGTTITAVTVREKFSSPGGVSGMPLAGTATSNTRPTTSAVTTREYYVTCTFSSGVESAESNHVTVSLPFGSSSAGGGSGTGSGATGTPAQILDIGTGASQSHFNVGVGYAASTHRDHTMAEIIGGYSESPYFVSNAAGNAVQFQTFANSGTTSGSPHARSELREMAANGTDRASWNASSGTHTMFGTTKPTHLPGGSKPWVTIAQIHDGADDVIRIQLEGTTLYSRTHSPNGSQKTEVKTSLKTGIAIGDDIVWKIQVVSGTAKIYVDDVQKFSMTISGSGMYFKAGCYIQFSTVSTDGGYAPSAYASVELRNFDATHA